MRVLSFRLRQFAMDVDHGELDHVGGGALDGCVDGVALRGAANGVVGGANVADVAAAAGDRLDITMLPREHDRVVHVLPDAGELLEILVNDVAGFLARDAQALGQAEGRDAVSDSEVNHLRLAPHLGRHPVEGDAKDPGRGGGMDVDARVERLQHGRLAAQRRNDAQLDLRVIRGQEPILVIARARRPCGFPARARCGWGCSAG